MSDFDTNVEEYDSVESDEVEDETSPEDETTPENGETPQGEASAGANVPATAKRQKDPLPQGWVTPVGLGHALKAAGVVDDITSQQCYGFAKTGAGFPVRFNTDGRYIVPVPSTLPEGQEAATYGDLTPETGEPEKDAIAWVRRQLQKRADRQAAKQAKAAAEAAAAASSNQAPAES